MRTLIKVGLTGGIATGKSTVWQRWQQQGAAAIDADQLAHRALEPGTPTYEEVVREFGAEILNPDGTVNRGRLGEIVFADEQKRHRLNRIIHPAVQQMWTAALEALEQQDRAEVAVVSIPLLYEVGAENQFDCVVVVGCSEHTQLARLANKGLAEPQAWARIRAQWPLQMKIDRADFVIWNDGGLQPLYKQCDMIWATIKESYHAPNKNP
jgi:dephospho-CoA kinase